MNAQRGSVTQRLGYIWEWGGDVGERLGAGRLALTGGLSNLTCDGQQADDKITSADNNLNNSWCKSTLSVMHVANACAFLDYVNDYIKPTNWSRTWNSTIHHHVARFARQKFLTFPRRVSLIKCFVPLNYIRSKLALLSG